MMQTAWPSLLVLPIVGVDGQFSQSERAGRVRSLYAKQIRAAVQLDHDGPIVGRLIYIEHARNGSYVAVAESSLTELDWRQQASLGADSLRVEHDHHAALLDHVALVERAALSADSVRLTRQAVRPP